MAKVKIKMRKAKRSADDADDRVSRLASVGRLADDDTPSLPDERTKPVADMMAYSWLLYGEKKVGKTSLCAEFPDCLILGFEPGGKALAAYWRPINKWADLLAYLKLLEKSDRFRTVAIDTAERMYDRCFEYVSNRELGGAHPHDMNDYGKSWGKIRVEFERAVERLLSMGRGVVFVSHAKLHDVQTRDGRTYHQLGPKLTGQPMECLEGLVDTIAYYGYDDDGDRVLTIRGNAHLKAGTRFEKHFQTSDGDQLIGIPMGGSAGEAYKALLAGYENRLDDAGSVPDIAPKKKARR